MHRSHHSGARREQWNPGFFQPSGEVVRRAPRCSNPTQASPAPAQQEDAAAKILKLKGLLDAGAISQAEFDQKKQEWLDKM